MKITTTEPSPRSQAMLKALQQAVTTCLERKQKLRQYAVVCWDGRPVRIGGEASKDAG
jgi:hypothetical protein